MIKKTVIVKTIFEALHCWADIPENHTSWYLRHPHRHVFQIELRFEVKGSNRDIEFIEFKQCIDARLKLEYYKDPTSELFDIKSTSCEMLAELLLNSFKTLGCYWVQVLEDGEMGAIVEVV